jgi:FMN-dependent NADH-azoreductase
LDARRFRLVTRNVATDGLRALSAAYAQGLAESWAHTSDAFLGSEQLIVELEQSAWRADFHAYA